MTIVVSGPVLEPLAGVAPAQAAPTGKARSNGEVILHLLDGPPVDR